MALPMPCEKCASQHDERQVSQIEGSPYTTIVAAQIYPCRTLLPPVTKIRLMAMQWTFGM
jgi:hypothetical protein